MDGGVYFGSQSGKEGRGRRGPCFPSRRPRQRAGVYGQAARVRRTQRDRITQRAGSGGQRGSPQTRSGQFSGNLWGQPDRAEG